MCSRSALAIVLFFCFPVCYILSHDYGRDLADTFRTYRTFYSRQHNLYRLSSSEAFKGFNESTEPELAPRIIHQILIKDTANSTVDTHRYSAAIQSCRSLHREWTHNLWTDSNASSFVATHYPQILADYVSYPQIIQRTNILRYLLLHHYGGVYLDLDLTCRQSLNRLLHLPFITPAAYPAGINNAFILSAPAHPFLSYVVDRISSRNHRWPLPYIDNMMSTGCMFVSNMWTQYESQSNGRLRHELVYLLAGEDGSLDGQMLRGKTRTPLFEHGGASSWHGWDAGFIIWVGKHYVVTAILVSALVGLSLVITLRLCLSARRKGRRRSGQHQKLFHQM